MTRVLILGGAGVFGRRLARSLAQTPGIEVVIAGRDLAKARAAAGEIGASDAAALDRTGCTAAQIKARGADIVVDAAGPFQGADLSFARAAIVAGAHYVDLADARDFVAAFPALDAEARAAGVIAVTGASSTPALTHALIDRLTAGWARIDHIRAAISASNRAPAGVSAMAAVLSWAGAPVRVFEEGAWRTRTGWSGARRQWIGFLGKRWLSLAETPDLDLLVSRYRPRDGAVFEAGLGLGVSHWAVELLAKLRRHGVIKDLTKLAPALHWIARRISSFGSKRSGMFVEVRGRNARDAPVYALARVTAYAGFGPYVPTIPALVLVRKIALGEGPPPGARACVGLLTLAELEAEFPGKLVRVDGKADMLGSPIALALGNDFANAPKAVRDAHSDGPIVRLRGAARVDGASNPLAALVSSVIGFPRTAAETTAEAEFRALADGRELWKRRIGGRAFESVLIHAGPNLCVEKFGLIELDLDVRLAARGVQLSVIGWRIAGVPLPRFLAPRSVAYEGEDERGRYTFDAPIALPLIGRLTHYRGFLTPAATPEIVAS